MNKRRILVIALGAGVLAAPFGSFAQQQGKVWRLGILSNRRVEISDSDNFYGAFRQGMRDLGYVEGKNLIIEWRSSEGKYERLPGLATELVNLKPDVIVTSGATAIKALQQATRTIPIVFLSTGDPVANGFAASLAHPGGNITGMSNQSGDLDAKRLEFLMTAVPQAKLVAEIVNPLSPSSMKRIPNLEAVVKKAGREFLIVQARSTNEFAAAFAAMTHKKVGALLVSSESLFFSHASLVAELALKHKIPTVFGPRDGVEAGGLMSFGIDMTNHYRYAAKYVDRIFKGASPGELPIEQPTKFEMVVNVKTAKALGIKIPDVIMLRADKVIE